LEQGIREGDNPVCFSEVALVDCLSESSCLGLQLDSDKQSTSATSEKQTGLSPSLIPCSKGLLPGATQDMPATTPEGLATWALPASVALTEGILVSFFTSA